MVTGSASNTRLQPESDTGPQIEDETGEDPGGDEPPTDDDDRPERDRQPQEPIVVRRCRTVRRSCAVCCPHVAPCPLDWSLRLAGRR